MVHIYPPISGRVLALKVLPGQEVSKGQTDRHVAEHRRCDRPASDYEKAKIEAARSDLQLHRGKDLLQHEVMAQKDYDDLNAVDEADARRARTCSETLQILGL